MKTIKAWPGFCCVSWPFTAVDKYRRGTLLMKNTEETRDANEDKQPHPKVQLARALTWRETGRVVVSGAIVLKLELVVPKIMLQTFGEIKADPKMPFRAVNVTGGRHLKNEIRFSGYHELFVTFQRVDIYFPRKYSSKLCWALNDNHAISLKGFLWRCYASINENKIWNS